MERIESYLLEGGLPRVRRTFDVRRGLREVSVRLLGLRVTEKTLGRSFGPKENEKENRGASWPARGAEE